jgi:hypothetical protein
LGEGKSGNIRRRPQKILIQAVIAAALPPTLGGQSVEIANQPLIRAEHGILETLMTGRKLIDPTLLKAIGKS